MLFLFHLVVFVGRLVLLECIFEVFNDIYYA